MYSQYPGFYRKLVFIILLLSIGLSLVAQAVPPPPPSPSSPNNFSAESMEDCSEEIVVKEGLVSLLKDIQLNGTTFIKRQLDSLRDGFTLKTFLIITFFSLAYGIFHTLGPGHGKLIVISFFLRDNTTKADAFSLSVIVSVIHSSAAIILAVLFQSLLSSVKGMAQIKVQNGFTLFSGVLILALGVIYLILHIKGKDHHSIKTKQPGNEETSRKGRWKRNLAVGLSIGIVPCPLSLTIMMLSIVYGIFWIGISSVISLTVAMVIVLYFLSVSTIKSRDVVEHRKVNKERKLLTIALNYSGNFALIFLGLYFTYKGVIAFF